MMRPGNKIIVLTEWLQPLQGGGNLVVYTQVSKGQCFGLPMDHPKIDSIYLNTGCLKCKHSSIWNHKNKDTKNCHGNILKHQTYNRLQKLLIHLDIDKIPRKSTPASNISLLVSGVHENYY